MEQSSPVNPTGQIHCGISGLDLSQIPTCEHLFKHAFREQSVSSYPGSQIHLLKVSQTPLPEQLLGQVFLLQSAPSNPGSQVHVPLKQNP